jgi:type IV secretion system protein VirB1
MQINSANLPALGMTVTDALDPCSSLAGGAAVLRAAYGGGSTQAEQQAALLMALSRYNTGTPFEGIMNGYVHTVLENTGKGVEAPSVPPPATHASNFFDLNAPPSWNVSAAGAYAQLHGASWIVDLVPSSATAGVTQNAPLIPATREQLPAASIVGFSTPPTAR